MRKWLSRSVLVWLLTGFLDGQQGQDKRPAGSNRMVSIVVTPEAIEPALVQLGSGKTWFAVHNRSGFRDIEVDLAPASSPATGRKNAILRGRKAWREAVDLTPGDYVLTVTGQPKFRCRIVVR